MEEDASRSRRQTVVVAGAGPVGLVAALELARRGLRPILLDSKAELSWTSRAVCISRRSQEIFHRTGISPAFFEKALPWSRGRTFHRDRLVFELEMPFSDDDRFAPFVNIQQFYTEKFLLETLHAIGPDACDIRWGHAIENVEQHEDGGIMAVRGPDGPYELAFDWLVAADGARSSVRASIGRALRGASYEGRYLIADIKVEGAEWPVERHVWFDPSSNPGSTVIVHVQPDDVWRIDIQIDPAVDDGTVLDDRFLLPLIARHLEDCMGIAAPFEVIWRSVYRAHARSLDDYRDGRIFFAGDAAHLVPIFGVRGLNSGIDDAHNLAWKLAMVIEGHADPRLLDSYSEERRAAALENLANAVKSTWFMSPPNISFAVLRDAVLDLAATETWARELLNPRQSAAHLYRASSAILHDSNDGCGEPGSVLASVRLKDGRFLHDLIAHDRLTLLVIGAFDTLADIAAAAHAMALHLVVVADQADRALASSPIILLVRPDEYVAARFEGFDLDRLRAAVQRARGHAPGPSAPFVPIDEVDGVVPRSPAEAIFSHLANGRKFAKGDTEAARTMLSEQIARLPSGPAEGEKTR